MAVRYRERRVSAGSGTQRTYQGALTGSKDNLASFDAVTDFVASGDGHNFDVSHLTIGGGILNYASSGSISGRIWSNWQLARLSNPNDSMYAHQPIPNQPSELSLAAKFLADTNPSRPTIDLPVSIYELREIPGLLREEGNRLIRNAAVGNLTYQFGIMPIVRDLQALLNFSDEVAKRQKELEKLNSGGLRRTHTLWSGSNATGPVDIIAQSGDKIICHLDLNYVTQLKISGHVLWKLDNPGMMSKGDMRAKARRAVLGLTVDFSTAWNALPWTWLIDWCSNVGDILISRRNIVGASHGPVQIMKQTITTAGFKPTTLIPYVSSGTWKKENKQRRSIVHVPVEVRLPILSVRQLSIIGSIGVTRRMPRSF